MTCWRASARLLLVDERGRVLLVRGHDPTDPGIAPYWFTPGGGVEPGETLVEAARREVREETGLEVADVGAEVYVRRAQFAYSGGWLASEEHFFRLDVTGFEPVTTGWTPLERRTLERWRWWTVEELRTADEDVYPEALADLLA